MRASDVMVAELIARWRMLMGGVATSATVFWRWWSTITGPAVFSAR
jgi:hypothetical protein